MNEKKLTEKDLRAFIRLLAGASPAPGGGGGSALIGATGTALGMMTAALTVNNPKYADLREGTQSALDQGMPLTAAFLDAVDRDAEVWKRSLRALLLPQDDKIQEEIRQDTLDQAARDCSRVPLDVLRLCKEATDLLLALEDMVEEDAADELGVAAAALAASARSSWLNILADLKSLSGRDDPFVISAYAEGKRIMEYVTTRCDAMYERMLAVCDL
ncbi:MAG: cyclodeaminase/cyclohydrolase family protein [Lachnospiraceae bacterium]|nr:cyclodeaminase/cyclohydrolase family protein [Lachnospiraceae bacterium]